MANKPSPKKDKNDGATRDMPDEVRFGIQKDPLAINNSKGKSKRKKGK